MRKKLASSEMDLGVSLVLGLLLVVALVVAVAMIGKNQDIRRGAFFAGSKLLLQPDSIANKMVGDEVPVDIYVETHQFGSQQEYAKVDYVRVKLCYGANLAIDGEPETRVTLQNENFNTLILARVSNADVAGYSKCADLRFKNEREKENLKSGMVKVASLRFRADSAGSGKVGIIKEGSEVSGYNPQLGQGSVDPAMEIVQVSEVNYVVGGAGNTAWPVLNYRLAYAGVEKGAKCAVNWPVSLVVMSSAGVVKNYRVVPEKDSSVTNRMVYKGSVVLEGLNERENLAVFFKGPKHIQVKYGVNNQVNYYNVAGGRISLTTDAFTSPVYDFSGYPLLAGDVTGPSAGVQDGILDGRDFAYVKNEAIGRKVVADGSYYLADLDGNCVMNSVDISTLMVSLNEKQGQLY